MEEIKVSEMLQADSINKDDSVMIIQEGVNKKASGSIQTATGTSLSLTSVADTCKIKSNSKNLFDSDNPKSIYINGSATYTNISNGIKVTKTATGVGFVLFEIKDITNDVGKTFTLKANFTSTGHYIIGLADANGENRISGASTTTSEEAVSYTIPEITTSSKLVIWLYGPDGATGDIDYTNIQVEEGSPATSYNPYNTKVIIADGDVSSPTIEAGTIQQATGQNATGSRMRSAGYIDVEPNKEYTLNADGNTAVVFEYKSDNTYIHRIPDNWIETPYTFTTTSETAKVRFVTESPNVTQDQIAFQEGSQSQKITLTPQEEKSVFTYDTKTGVLSNGSVTITYNTKGRLLNNNDVLDIVEPVKEYVDGKTEEIYSTDEKRIGTWKDGRTLYRKVIDYTIPSGTTSIGISLGVSNLRLVQRAEVRFNSVGSGDYVFNSYYSSASDYMRFFMRSNELQIRLGSNTSGFNIVAIVEYTKTTDA